MADGIIGGVALALTENALIAAPAGQSVEIGIFPSRRRHALARKNPSRHGGAITVLTDDFCEKHLNDEYRVLIHRVIGSLARKRPSPLLKGKENAWAAGAIHAVGRANFLDDPSQVPHFTLKTIYEFFGIAGSTGQNKSKEIRNALGIEVMNPDWTLPSRLADNALVWMVEIDGLIIDIRQAAPELQRLAYEKGLIPFIPAERSSPDP